MKNEMNGVAGELGSQYRGSPNITVNNETVTAAELDDARAASKANPPPPQQSTKPSRDVESNSERSELAPLFAPAQAADFRAQWARVQQGFVDDPRRAVLQGDELVTQVMSSLTQTFAKERATVEDQLEESANGSTEMLRVALRRYRSFFERLLSV
jgi:hypothetical protein